MNANALKILSVAIVIGMTGCAVTGTQDVVKPEAQKSGLFGLAKTAELTVDGDKAFAGVNRVVIGSFKLAFIDSKKEAEKAGMGVGGRSSAKLELQGLTPALMQEVTDQAYADFVSQLQAAGYTVENRQTLTSSTEFAKANKEPSPLVQEASFFGSSNNVHHVAPSAIGSLYFFMGETGPNGGFGFSNPSVAASSFADKQKLPVISVQYTLDFAAKNGSGGRFASTSSLEVGQALSITPGSGLSLVGGMGGTFNTTNGSLRFGQALTSPDKFGEVVMTTSDTMKTLETVGNVATALLGAGTSQHRDFAVKADPVKYESAAGAILREANSKVLAKMQSLR